MSEREAFLRAIRENPDDDTARLVFADWLDEHDDPLGTFIRVQLELHPIRDRIDKPHVKELWKKEAALLRKHRKKWLGKAAGIGKGIFEYETNIVIERGLPARARLSLDTLLSEGKKLFDACPTLYEVAVFDVQNRGAELANYPLLDRIDRLEIADWPTEEDTAALFASSAFVSRPVIRAWTGTDVKQCCLNWIHKKTVLSGRLELVQLPPGIDAAVKKFATRFHRKHGSELYILRPFDVTFAFESSHGKNTGRLPDGRPAYLAVQYNELWAVLVIFDEDGNILEVQRWQPPANAEKGWADERANLKPGLIRMKAFDLEEGIGISFWDGNHWEDFESPFEPDAHEDDEWWRGRGGRIRGWIERGDFVVTFGDSDEANRYTGH